MADMSLKKHPMPRQTAEERVHNFNEVALGYTKEAALQEAQRCLHCKNAPCVTACPVNVPIPDFIEKIKAGDATGAYRLIYSQNMLPAICGRVCQQENQCESKCVRGIKGEPVGIGYLERFAADEAFRQSTKGAGAGTERKKSAGRSAAMIGSGPSSLACAATLAMNGWDVTVYEALHTAGGVLMYGIPEFRLPEAVVQREIDSLKQLGVKIVTNAVIGKCMTVDEILDEGADAVFIGTGAGLPSFQKIPGESLSCVYSANEFLTRMTLMKAYRFPETDTPIRTGKKIIVIGAGNVAMDAARSAKRFGCDVTIMYRRSEKEMTARQEEAEHAREEGIDFQLLTGVTEIIGDENNCVKAVRCVRMELGEPDERGRRRPIPIKDSEFTAPADSVVVAIGNSPNPMITKNTPDLPTDKHGCIIADEAGRTAKKHVYAGGDAVTGAATVIRAMGAGKRAAEAIMADHPAQVGESK